MAESVMKMEISYKKAVDEEEQKKIDAVKRIIDEAFCTVGIDKKENDMYIGNGDGKDYTAFTKVAVSLIDYVGFLKYIDKWLYYDEHGNVEDYADFFKRKAGIIS